MMAAMMFPSIAPMVVMYARIQEGRRERGAGGAGEPHALFVAGYLVSWAAAGLVGYGLYELGPSALGDAFAWDNAGPYLAGGIIVAAAHLPADAAQGRLPALLPQPADVPHDALEARAALGALRMGIEHGGWCVGCCWMLMAALFALGVMSIGWMAFIAALIAIEKLLPWKDVANRGIAVLLLVLGLAVAFAPEDVPGLTQPGSPEAQSRR